MTAEGRYKHEILECSYLALVHMFLIVSDYVTVDVLRRKWVIGFVKIDLVKGYKLVLKSTLHFMCQHAYKHNL